MFLINSSFASLAGPHKGRIYASFPSLVRLRDRCFYLPVSHTQLSDSKAKTSVRRGRDL